MLDICAAGMMKEVLLEPNAVRGEGSRDASRLRRHGNRPARTAVAEVDDAAPQQDHEAVEEREGIRRRAVDGRADGDAAPHQRLHLRHHLNPANMSLHVSCFRTA